MESTLFDECLDAMFSSQATQIEDPELDQRLEHELSVDFELGHSGQDPDPSAMELNVEHIEEDDKDSICSGASEDISESEEENENKEELSSSKWSKYEWTRNGHALLKNGWFREYKRCRAKNCRAKMTVTWKDGRKKKIELERTFANEHNHSPTTVRSNPRGESTISNNKEEKDEYESLEQNEVTSAKDPTESSESKPKCVNIQSPASSKKDQISVPDQISKRFEMSETSVTQSAMPSMDSIKTILDTHYNQSEKGGFVQNATLLPYLGMVFFDQEHIAEILANFGHVLYLDQFSFTTEADKGDLTLITMMINYKDIGVPFAYYITNRPTVDSYVSFLSRLDSQIGFTMQPKFIIMPLDQQLVKACIEQFGTKPHLITSSIFFIKEIVRSTQGLDDYKGVIESLKLLANAHTKDAFDNLFNSIRSEWTEKLPLFMSYFFTSWIDERPPHIWALAHQDIPPSSNQIVGAWNTRINAAIVNQPFKTLAAVVNFLFVEWFYNLRIVLH